MDYTDLGILNPWWKGKGHLIEDKNIREYEEKRYKWQSPLLNAVIADLKKGNIFTLRGPRQVGKTTFVKLIIKALLDKIDEKSVFYWNCDVVRDEKELVALVRSYLLFIKTFNINENYIFLDEISSVKNWQKAIKFLVDSGELGDSCIFLTGSHTLDIKYSIEMLPGRLGREAKNYLLLPLSFREFVEIVRPELGRKIYKIRDLDVKEIRNKLASAVPFDSELSLLFNQYLICGGFPLTINEFFKNNELPEYVFDIYSGWVVGDFVKWGKQEKILMQVLKTIINKQSSAVNWHSFAKDAEIKSHKTVSAYMEDLENMFVICLLYYIDIHKKIENPSKNKKIYFFDPFISNVFSKKFYIRESKPGLVESAAIVNTARFCAKNKKISETIFYWRNKKEIDAVIRKNNGLFGLEVKYQENISKSDFNGLHYLREGVLLTKKHKQLDGNYLAIPVHLFLSLL